MSCSPRRAGGDNRSVIASARSRQARIQVVLAPTGGGTQVAVRAQFTAGDTNPIRTETFTADCRSTGLIEAVVLEAAGR